MGAGRESHGKNLKKSGIFELFIPDIKEGDLYKFAVETAEGNILYKGGSLRKLCPKNVLITASVVTNIEHFQWDGSGLGR